MVDLIRVVLTWRGPGLLSLGRAGDLTAGAPRALACQPGGTRAVRTEGAT